MIRSLHELRDTMRPHLCRTTSVLSNIRFAGVLVGWCSLFVGCAALGFFPAQAAAGIVYWDANEDSTNNTASGTDLGGSGTWDATSLKWWPDLAAADQAWNNGSWDTAVFSGVGGTVSLGAPISAGGLIFAVDGYTISGNTLTLGGSGSSPEVTVTNAGTTATIQSAVALGSNATFGGEGNLTASGVISGSGFGFTKTGGGTLTVNQANTFTGVVTLNAGTLKANGNAGALGTGAATLVLNGGTLDFNHSAAISFNRNTTVAGNAEIVAEKNVAGAGVTYTLGTLSIGASTLTVSGGNVTSGTAGVTFGATTITGDTTFVVNKPVGGGTTVLTLGAVTSIGHTLTIKGTGNLAQSTGWNVTGPIVLDSAFTGRVTFSTTNTLTGGVALNGGTLMGGSQNSLGGSANTITFGGAGTAQLLLQAQAKTYNTALVAANADGTITINPDVSTAGVTHTLGAITLGGGHQLTVAGGTLVASGTAGLKTGTVTLGSGGAILNIINPAATNTATLLTLGAVNGGSDNITIKGNGNLAQSAAWSGTGASVTLDSTYTGTVTFSQTNTFTGGVIVRSGTAGSTSSFGFGNGEITLGDDLANSNNVKLTTAINTGNVANAIVLASGTTGTISVGITNNSSPTTYSGGITGTNNVVLRADGAGNLSFATGLINNVGTVANAGSGTGTNTISATIGANVTGVTQNSSTSTLILSGFNNYSGPTTVTTGTLQLAKATAIYGGAASRWTADQIVVNSGATLAVSVGGTGEFTSANLGILLGVGTSSGGFMDGSFVGFDTTNAAVSFTYASAIANPNGGTNSLGVVKLGAGKLILSGANTYTGQTIVVAGALSGNLGSSNLVLNGGVYEDNGTFSRELGTGAGQIQWASGAAGGFSAQGGALSVTLGSTASPLVWGSTPAFVSASGQLLFGSSSSDSAVTFTNDIDLNGANRTIQVVDNANSTTDRAVLAGVISGTNGGIVKTGSGELQLTGANTFTGAVSVSNGTLTVSSIGRSGTAASNLGAGNATMSLGSGSTTGGTLNYTGTGETTDRAILLAATTTGAGQINSNGTGALEWSGNVTSSGTTKTFTLGGTYTGDNKFSGAINLGTGSLAKADAGTWVLSNTTAYVNLTVSGGTLRLAGVSTLGTGAVAITNGTLDIAGTVDQTAAGMITLAGGATGSQSFITIASDRTLTVNGGITFSSGNNNLTGMITGGTLNLGAADRTFAIGNSTAQDADLWITSAITSTGGGLVKSNSGTLVLTGNNTYTGSTFLNAGTVEASALTNLGVSNIVFNGGSLRWAAGANFDISARTVTFTGAAILDTNGNDVTLANAIGNLGAGGLTKNGLGTLRLSAAATYTGTTTINNGTLALGGDTMLAGLTMGSLAADSSATLSIDTKVTLGGDVTYSSTNNSLSATIAGNAGAVLDFGGVARKFTIGNSTNAAVDMQIAANLTLQNGSLTKLGSGSLLIAGTNNLTSVEVQAGAVSGNLGTSNLILNGGVYEGNGLFTSSLGTGNGQVQWVADAKGGFSARDGVLTVTLGSASDPLVWGTTSNFVTAAGSLLLNSATANNVVTLTNNIDLNNTGNAVARTITVDDNSLETTDKAVLSGVLSQSGTGAATLVKAGSGFLELTGSNTFTGGVIVQAGTVQFSTVTNNNGEASNLGKGVDGITLSGGALQFIGTENQSTDRGITLNANSTLAADGTNGATITYNGIINSPGYTLTLVGAGKGLVNGTITQTGTAADLYVNSGNWTLGGVNAFADDVYVSGANTVLNLDVEGALVGVTGNTSNYLYIKDGAVVNLNANDVTGKDNSGGSEGFLVGDGATPNGPATLHTNGHSVTLPRLDLGDDATDGEGLVDGNGTLTVTSALNLYRGTLSANVAGAGAITKSTTGTVTLAGAVSLTGITTVKQGQLILDYTTNNAEKLNDSGSGALTLVDDGTLTINGSTSAGTQETVGDLTINAGDFSIVVNNGSGQTAALILNTITRKTGSSIDFSVSSSDATIRTGATNNSVGILGGYATFGGTAFATVSDGKIAGLVSTAKNNLADWSTNDHVTDATGGYTGTVGNLTIGSLRFGASGGVSTVSIADGSALKIASGGILVTSNVGTGLASIVGGRLQADSQDLVVHQNNTSADFTISSAINGSVGLTKAGEGRMVLSGTANTYSGATTIASGTLALSDGNAIGDFSPVAIKNVAGATLDLQDGTESIGTLSGAGTFGGVVAIGAGKLTVYESAASTYSGQISGSGSFIKTGASTLTLDTTANSAFTGKLIINQGQLTLGNRTVSNFSKVGSVILNSGALLLDHAGGTETADKINNSATVTLINTGGTEGLRANNDRSDASKAETVGAVTLLAGSNTITSTHSSTATTGTQRSMALTLASLTRSNAATLLVRGKSLGTLGDIASAGHYGKLVVTSAPTLTGGNGAAGSTTISILPWVIGDTSATGNGSSFVTYGTNGFRPLDLANEYEQLQASGGVTVGNNVRYSGTSDLPLDGSTPRTMHSLLLDNTGSSAITLSGANASLNVASGAFLFTGTQGISVSGFTGITNSRSEYVMHVVNTATAGVTISAPFTTASSGLTKSGAGTLILAATGSTYTGVTTVNQGMLQIDSLNKLGNNGHGGLVLNGGTLRFGAAFDPTAIAITFGVPVTDDIATTARGHLRHQRLQHHAGQYDWQWRERQLHQGRHRYPDAQCPGRLYRPDNHQRGNPCDRRGRGSSNDP